MSSPTTSTSTRFRKITRRTSSESCSSIPIEAFWSAFAVRREKCDTLRSRRECFMTDFHSQFLTLVDEIETSFPVADWRVGDVPVWPLARTSLYSNLYRQRFGTRQKAQVSGLRRLSGRIAQAASYAATPLTNIWQSRGDLRHMILLPHRANAIFAGDGDSLDFIDGSFRDRFSEPLISYLQNNGQSTLLMQRGEICHLPWSRPTFAANTIIHWGRLSAEGLRRSSGLAVALPDHQLVRKFLDSKGVPIHGLAVNELRDRAAVVGRR